MASRKSVRVSLVVAIVAVLVALVVILNLRPDQGKVLVGIIEPMQHIAIADITRGIKDGLFERHDIEVRVMNANGDATTIPQIIQKFRDDHVAIYVPIFTKTAQVTKTTVSDAPIVFAAVTDPVQAGLLKNPDAPEGNITGVSDLWPIAAQMELMRALLPSAKTIGIVYDPGDASAAVTMPIIQKEAPKHGFGLEVRPVHATNEVAQALSSLHGKADLLFTANDVTVTAAFPALVEFAIQNRMPLFAGDYSSVKRGAVGAVGQNYYNVGQEAAQLVEAIADGERISSLPVRYTTGGDLYLNLKAAELMGVTVPDSLRTKAKEAYTDIGGG